MNRRDFLAAATVGAAAAQASSAWDSGRTAHLLATAGENRILLKASFREPLSRAPELRAGQRRFPGQRSDSAGLFWRFDAAGLPAGAAHRLELRDGAGRALCAPWTLKTLPPAGSMPESFRLLIYTCAGGHDALADETGERNFLLLSQRRRLLQRALSFQPDAVVANGDHVYWDLRTSLTNKLHGASKWAVDYAGRFDRVQPVFGTPNERVLQRAAGPQIADLYQNDFREVPVFFLSDDHDYYDNDEATDALVTFPPDDFQLRLARATRRLYYPEFLPDAMRPLGLPGASAGDTDPGVSESYGTLRFGKLAEILMYDCRRFLTLTGPSATFVAPEAESWIKERLADPGLRHVIQVPSTPPGWTAGKWGEWYPDVLQPDGKLGVARPKPYWQPGWLAQHDRLLTAASAMRDRVPLIVNGDLHAIAEGHILRCGPADFRENPVVSILAGPVGTARRGWPSFARNTPPLPPARVSLDERLKPIEENGFLILDFRSDRIRASFFRWSPRDGDAAMDALQPFRVSEFPRRA